MDKALFVRKLGRCVRCARNSALAMFGSLVAFVSFDVYLPNGFLLLASSVLLAGFGTLVAAHVVAYLVRRVLGA